MQPRTGETIQDPAAGSGGFLIGADHFVRSNSPAPSYTANPPRYEGAEIEKNTRRICLMNTFLNGLDANIIYGDALTADGESLQQADLILANPPFGSKAGSRRALRKEIPYPNTNKQLIFLQHIYLSLKLGGRAAVVLPDNALFEEGVGTAVRRQLMEMCNLHTILRLPKGIFSSAGVKTNVLFFTREESTPTETVWVYDLRANMPAFGKINQLSVEHFVEFERCFGNDANGKSRREDQGETGRFRSFERDEIAERKENLDFSWLRDESSDDGEALSAPQDIAQSIQLHLRAALSEIDAIADSLAEVEANKE